MHHEKVLQFYPYRLFGVDGNAEHPDDSAGAASLERHTQLTLENDMLHLRGQQSNTCKSPRVGMGIDALQFSRHSHISLALDFQFGRSTPAPNPVPLFRLLENPRSLLKFLKRMSVEKTKILAGFIPPRVTENSILDLIKALCLANIGLP